MQMAGMEKFLHVVCSVFDAYSTVLFLPKPQSKKFYLSGYFSLGNSVVENISIAPGQGLVGWILRNKKNLLINNFDRKRSHIGYYNDATEQKIKAFMGTSLSTGGALCLDSKRTYSFSGKDQKVLEMFAMLATELCDITTRWDQDASGRVYYTALEEISNIRSLYPVWPDYLRHFLKTVKGAAGIPYCFLAVRDEYGKNYYLEGLPDSFFPQGVEPRMDLPIKSGLIGWVFNSGQPVFSKEQGQLSKGQSLFGRNLPAPLLHSVALTPLLINNKIRAVLVFAHTEPLSVSPELEQFITLITENLTLYLESLYWRQ